MDEGLGALIGIVAAIVFIVWLVGQILKGLAWLVEQILTGLALLFLALTSVFGHPVFVLLLGSAVGAAIGIIMHRHARGAFVARSSEDFAQIGAVRLTPEGWAGLVVALFIVMIGLMGISRS